MVVPESMHEVTVGTYMQLVKAMRNQELTDVQRQKKAVQILCGLTAAQQKRMPVKYRDEIVATIDRMLERTYRLQRTFEHDGTTYGLHPILDEMSLGEFVDARAYAGDPEKVHRFLAVVYRPISATKKERYQIEPYGGSDKYKEVMRQQPASLYLGLEAFFLHLANVLMTSTLSSTKRAQTPQIEKGAFPKSGDTME